MGPDNLAESDLTKMNFGSGGNRDSKAWKSIWGCGQGAGVNSTVRPAVDIGTDSIGEYSSSFD